MIAAQKVNDADNVKIQTRARLPTDDGIRDPSRSAKELNNIQLGAVLSGLLHKRAKLVWLNNVRLRSRKVCNEIVRIKVEASQL